MIDRNAWNKFVAAHGPRSGAFLQSWEWGEFLEKSGSPLLRFSEETSEVEALAQVQTRLLPFGLRSAYIPRGPIAKDTQSGAVQKIIENISAAVARSRAATLRIDPAVNLNVLPGEKTVRPLQPQTTVLLDLGPAPEQLLAAMHEKTRYNIRLAERKGVTVRHGDAELFSEFWRLLDESAIRDKFCTHPRGYYQKMVEALAGDRTDRSSCHATIFLADFEGRPLAGMLLITFGDSVVYLHGGSSNENRNLMAPYLLHWSVIKHAQTWGYKTYDLWGIAPEGIPDHPLAGVTRFKRGFGGEVWKSPDSLELPVSTFWYNIYALAQRLRGRR